MHILEHADDPEGFFDRLVFAANSLRGWQRIDHESSVAGRRDNLSKAIKAIRRGEPPSLSVANAMERDMLHSRFPDTQELELLQRLRKGLPKPGKGRPPIYSMRFMGVEIADACREHCRRPPSSAAGGDYVTLLEVVAHVATGKPYKTLHTLAEYCLKIEVIKRPGIREFSVL
jgi:hypothetical protein